MSINDLPPYICAVQLEHDKPATELKAAREREEIPDADWELVEKFYSHRGGIEHQIEREKLTTENN